MLTPPQNLDLNPLWSLSRPKPDLLSPGPQGEGATAVGTRRDPDQNLGSGIQGARVSKVEIIRVEVISVKGIQGGIETVGMYAGAAMTTASGEMMRDAAEGQDPDPGQEKGAGPGHGRGIAGHDQGQGKGADAVEAVRERGPWTSGKKLSRNWLPLKQRIQI